MKEKNEKGFTLIELLIAVGILAIVIGPYMTQFVTSTKIGERSERVVLAESVAQNVLEEEKRLPQIPDAGNSRSFVRDGFTVRITYSDQGTSVKQSDKELDIYDSNIDADITITPVIKTGKLDLVFKSGETLLQTISAIPFDKSVTLYLRSGDVSTNYKLVCEYPTGTEVAVEPSFIKLTGEPVKVKFITPLTSQADTLLSMDLQNDTSGGAERKLELYEYDDENNNFSFKTSNASIGDVQTILGLSTAVTSTIDNTQDYYWVQIEVETSSGEVISELYSSVRKE